MLVLRVRVKNFRFLLVLAGYSLTGLLLGVEPIIRLLPGAWGREARGWFYTALAALWALLGSGSETLAEVDVESPKDGRVRVELFGIGFPMGESGPRAGKPAGPLAGVAARLAGCLGAFLLCRLLFPGSLSLRGVLFGGLLLTVLYLLIRPVLQAVLLPLNLLFFGVFTPLADALLVLWACAWAPGAALSYWPAVCCALLCSLFWLPYGAAKRRSVLC